MEKESKEKLIKIEMELEKKNIFLKKITSEKKEIQQSNERLFEKLNKRFIKLEKEQEKINHQSEKIIFQKDAEIKKLEETFQNFNFDRIQKLENKHAFNSILSLQSELEIAKKEKMKMAKLVRRLCKMCIKLQRSNKREALKDTTEKINICQNNFHEKKITAKKHTKINRVIQHNSNQITHAQNRQNREDETSYNAHSTINLLKINLSNIYSLLSPFKPFRHHEKEEMCKGQIFY